jgi:hypothetical protein
MTDYSPQKRRADVMENKENVENMEISSKGRLPAVLAEFDIEGTPGSRTLTKDLT